MSSRPTGTVTFLFTDIEGSTRLWEAHGKAMRSGLEQHDRLLRGAIEGSGGYVFSTAGDAFAAAFADPSTALAAAIAGQRAIRDASWGDLGTIAVRMALHTGVAHERDGDYFGPALNRVSRILGAGHGGQILLSLGTEEIVGGSLDTGVSLRDLGEHTLKDLGRPERIYQVVHPDLRDDFPELRSLDALPNNLPVQLTSFVGRELELNEVVKRLGDNRLLTLTGVGGSGKTRLALQAAAENSADYPNGVWLVELAAIGDADLVPVAISDALGITRSQGSGGNPQLGTGHAETLDQVTSHLAHRTVLLVVDNCEHLITATAGVVQHLLQHCPGLSVIATSREGLGVPGEVLWQVPSLGTAEDGDPLTSDAVRLFLDRAEDANPRFSTDADSLRWVRQICERLDGMPLAIELAAARARVLDAKQLAERLDDRFRLLTGGSRTALPRHQTLEATVDWSYDLMSETERSVFQRLAAFRGGFTLEAAEVVCGDETIDRYEVLDLIGSLVDKSMLVRDEITGRFAMLETLRQYALRRLAESDEVDRIRVRHADFFLQFAETTVPQLAGPEEASAFRRLSADHDNLRAALSYGLENALEATAAAIAAELGGYWWAASDVAEGLEWTRRTLPHRELLEGPRQVELLAFAGLFAGFQLDPDARALAEEALSIALDIGDPRGEAMAHLALGNIDWTLSRYDDAKGHMLRARDAASRAEDVWLMGNATLNAAFSDRLMSRLDDAEVLVAEAERAYREAGQPSGLGWVLSIAGQIARYRGDFETEVVKQREARSIFEAQGTPFETAFALVSEAIALNLLNRPEEAVTAIRQGIVIQRDLTINFSAIEVLALGAWIEHDAGNLTEAHDLYVEAIRLCAPHFDRARLELICSHLMEFTALLERWDDAARLDGFRLANLSRPEPEIYARHALPRREAYRAALGSGADALVDEGGSMSGEQVYEFALGVLAEIDDDLSRR